MSDAFWGGLFTLAGLLIVAWQQIRTSKVVASAGRKAEQSAAIIAEKTDAAATIIVAKTIETGAKVDGVARETLTIRKHVNAQYGASLEVSSLALRRVAELTKDTEDGPKDAAIAVAAETKLREHRAEQAEVDGASRQEVNI